MKLLLALLGLTIFSAAWAEPAPIDEPTLSIYSMDKKENSCRAIRLGYKNFHLRLNTQAMTSVDEDIVKLIQGGFFPLFGKLSQLENLPKEERTKQSALLEEEFGDLVIQLAQLLFKNQHRYTNPLFLSDQAALDETVLIVQEAADRGSF